MFEKIFEYAGPHKKGIYTATAVMLLSVLMGVLPFVLAYQIIAPLVMGDPIESGYITMRLTGILVCLVLQAILNGWGLDISHRAAYNTLTDWIDVDFSRWGSVAENENRMFQQLKQAILENRELTFDYHNSTGESSKRSGKNAQ